MKPFFTKCVKGYQCLGLHAGGIWADTWRNQLELRFWSRERFGKRLASIVVPSDMMKSHFLSPPYTTTLQHKFL